MKINLATAAIWKNRISHAVVSIGPRPARACINSQVDRLTLLAKVELRQEEGIDPELLELLG